MPYLGYAAGAYLGRVTELILKESAEAVHLERVYETDMAEGLKAMALEGHGVAFLPYSAVRGELESGRLVSAVPEGVTGFQMDMEVRAYREKPSQDARKELLHCGPFSRNRARPWVPKSKLFNPGCCRFSSKGPEGPFHASTVLWVLTFSGNYPCVMPRVYSKYASCA